MSTFAGQINPSSEYDRQVPKVLQLHLKNRELGYTDEQQHVRMERDLEANRRVLDRTLNELLRKHEELEVYDASLFCSHLLR